MTVCFQQSVVKKKDGAFDRQLRPKERDTESAVMADFGQTDFGQTDFSQTDSGQFQCFSVLAKFSTQKAQTPNPKTCIQTSIPKP